MTSLRIHYNTSIGDVTVTVWFAAPRTLAEVWEKIDLWASQGWVRVPANREMGVAEQAIPWHRVVRIEMSR